MPWEAFFEKFIAGEVNFGSYFEHVASWWAVRQHPNVLVIRYEVLQNDPENTVRQIGEFIGVPLSDERLGEIIEATSLKSMKKWKEGLKDKVLSFTGACR